MMMRPFFVAATALVLALTSCARERTPQESAKERRQALQSGEREKPDTLVAGGYDRDEMDRAIARAKSEVDNFISILEKGEGSDFSVKAPITEQGETEFFWVTDVTYKNGVFTGTIDNEPGVVTTVQLGQRWRVKKEEIADWSFKRNGKIHGNYTMRPLLKALPKEEADAYRSLLADP